MVKIEKPNVSEADLTAEFLAFEARAAALSEGVNQRQERLAILKGLLALRRKVREVLKDDAVMPFLMRIIDTYRNVVAGIEWPEFEFSMPKPSAAGWFGIHPGLDFYRY